MELDTPSRRTSASDVAVPWTHATRRHTRSDGDADDDGYGDGYGDTEDHGDDDEPHWTWL
ncbi:GL25422 [Drosophila persimilis]|uniref:GL25422 n=1 Tax=Drosophila persimilis TaxID=7234 RepID=B4H8P6_DROPE|nr:GL25422 [Drosophila persimilis]